MPRLTLDFAAFRIGLSPVVERAIPRAIATITELLDWREGA